MEITSQKSLPKTVIITCAVLEEEVAHYARGLSHIVAVEILPQGLHNEPDRLRTMLQAAVDKVEAEHAPEAIVLGYGLCSRGTEGVTTRSARMVIARAHDCITLLLGSRERYADYVAENPGTYWYSPGWNKHHIPPGERRYLTLLTQYTEKYGEDNASYLMEAEQHWFTSYDRASYVDLNVGPIEEDVEYTRQCADWLNWKFDWQRGDSNLLRSMLECRWDDRFLILEPGQSLRMTADEKILEAVDAPEG